MKKFLLWTVAVLAVGLIAFAVVVVLFPIPEPNESAVAESSEVYYADGTSLVGSFGEITRSSVPLAEIPVQAQRAVLAAEDRGFYEHWAIDPVAITRAFINNLTGGSTQGGSTITQQYVKNLFLTQDQTYVRKIKELIISIKIEVVKSKDGILDGYLNTIYYGRGAYGIEAASQIYFGHPASELTLNESVALAAMIQAPGGFEPEENAEGLAARMKYVADGMVEQGWITAEEGAAVTLPTFLPKAASENRLQGEAGYIMQTVRSEMEELGYTDDELDAGGLRIISTIDKLGQEAVTRTVAENGPENGTEGLRIGIAAIDPATGGIIAMYGGPDYLTNQLNNATQARGQGGSTFKPFALTAAFQDNINLESMWNGNSPQTISGYTLENEGNKSWGIVSLLEATENSINTPFVHVEDEVGVDKVIDAAYKAGLPQDTPGIEQNLTFVLGTASPTPVELASTYTTFATRGLHRDPTIIKQVFRGQAEDYAAQPGGEKRFEANIMDNVNFALQKVVTNGTGKRASELGRPAAGKTGTTDDNKSAWYVGYTPQMVAAVMMVKEDENGNPVSLSGTGGLNQVFGGSFPLAMWLGFAEDYLADKPVEEFVKPEKIPGTNNPAVAKPSPSAIPTEQPSPTATPEPSPGVPPTASPEPSETADRRLLRPRPSAPAPSPVPAP